MKLLEKNRAIELRKQGKTYGEIQKIIPTPKGSLSYWLRDIRLNRQQLKHVYQKNFEIRRKFIKYNQLKRKQAIARRNYISQLAQREIKKVSKRELKLVGAALYWAEGTKVSARGGSISFTNSDPVMIKLIIRWFREMCEVPKSKFRLSVLIHNPKRLEIIERYWSRLTGIPLRQFNAPILRISKTSQRKRGNILPYGVLNIRFSDVKIFSKILGWIRGLGGPMV